MTRKLVIYLYSAAPLALACQRQTISWRNQVKRELRSAYARLAWVTRRRLVGHYSDFISNQFANRGDVALALAAREQLTDVLAPSGIEFREISWGRLTASLVDEINDQADAFVIGGGGFFFFRPNGEMSASRKEDCLLISAITRPVYCFGTGTNMLQEDSTNRHVEPNAECRELLARLSERIRWGTVRDPVTAQLLENAGATVVRTIDPAFFLRASANVPAQRPDNGTLQVGINLAVHGPYTFSLQQRTMADFIVFLKYIGRDANLRLRYFAHEPGELSLVRLLQKEGLNCDVIDAAPAEMLAAYAKLDLHICQMMHSAIFATSCAVPTMCLSYDAKHAMFFETLDLLDWCLPAAKATSAQLIAYFESLRSQRENIRAHLIRKKDLLTETYDSAMRQLGVAILDGLRPAA